ncbi:adenosine deaminase [Thecamonas trahens ATCC 50062]|uniref:Adenosine deaminase n=1 Tax=Thecamonas trahens ATCC 50062 TaxID=461836 RepID=A0A0L0D859_THETB|nr:adenosine deaminase [Thecamonas trahens ATCC 50062]KNC48251.1 adenosine deaminase [Thecamonas trahens ATCC 50062]|eukprot:XP_013758820.1 adenosine deaminase [Thecamonas trahens ATCC 50062]
MAETEGDIAKVVEVVRGAPKVELHVHLAGAMPQATLDGLCSKYGVAPRSAAFVDYATFIETWVWMVDELIREADDYRRIAEDALTAMATQSNVVYAEVFCSPGTPVKEGKFSLADALDAILAGAAAARAATGIEAVFVVDLERLTGPEWGMALLDSMAPYVGKGVIGVGLGGPEAACEAEVYAPVFARAREMGLRLTAHCGESQGAPEVAACLDALGIERIGHGVRIMEDPELVVRAAGLGVPFEVCLTSNVATGLVASIQAHPLPAMLAAGLVCTLNSDDPLFFDTTLADEYAAAVTRLGMDYDAAVGLLRAAIATSWAPDAYKAELEAQLDAYLER